MNSCEYCDGIGIITIDCRLLCHKHALKAITEKQQSTQVDVDIPVTPAGDAAISKY